MGKSAQSVARHVGRRHRHVHALTWAYMRRSKRREGAAEEEAGVNDDDDERNVAAVDVGVGNAHS